MTPPWLGETPFRARPLGAPIPDGVHAVSVSLPTWADVVGYEDGDANVVAAISSGYPRFVVHPAVQTLCTRIAETHAGAGETVMIWPSTAAALRCVDWLARQGHAARAISMGAIAATVFAQGAQTAVRQMWQHSGDIVSSRRAMAVLEERADEEAGATAKLLLKERLGDCSGAPPSNVRLFPSGMSALHGALRLVGRLRAGLPTAQMGFPYVDTLKLQERIGVGVHFYPRGDAADLDALQARLAAGEVGAVFTEVPTNPLMTTIDLPRLSSLTRAAGVPLVVDDSAATFFNLDLSAHADLLVSSLTKHFAGSGDVMGGVLVLNPSSPMAAALAARLDDEDLLWGEDAEVLLTGSETFETRMPRVNRTAARLAAALARHPAVGRVHYPVFDKSSPYRDLVKPGGGFGGMLSIELADPTATPAFYDALTIDKGPSFGMRTTLACPYTLLAHYNELDWAESCGVSRHLIRVSVGLEDADDLIERFTRAL